MKNYSRAKAQQGRVAYRTPSRFIHNQAEQARKLRSREMSKLFFSRNAKRNKHPQR